MKDELPIPILLGYSFHDDWTFAQRKRIINIKAKDVKSIGFS